MTDLTNKMVLAVNHLLNRYLVRGADGLERPIPYNPIDYQTIRFVAANPHSRATDVASHLGTPPTTMQSALDRMVRRGLLDKHASENDKRARLYTLTEMGMRIHDAINTQDRANMTDILSPLTPKERETLVYLLERVL